MSARSSSSPSISPGVAGALCRFPGGSRDFDVAKSGALGPRGRAEDCRCARRIPSRVSFSWPGPLPPEFAGHLSHAGCSAPGEPIEPALLERKIGMRGDIGAVHQPITASAANVQAYYDQGLTLLHHYSGRRRPLLPRGAAPGPRLRHVLDGPGAGRAGRRTARGDARRDRDAQRLAPKSPSGANLHRSSRPADRGAGGGGRRTVREARGVPECDRRSARLLPRRCRALDPARERGGAGTLGAGPVRRRRLDRVLRDRAGPLTPHLGAHHYLVHS